MSSKSLHELQQELKKIEQQLVKIKQAVALLQNRKANLWAQITSHNDF